MLLQYKLIVFLSTYVLLGEGFAAWFASDYCSRELAVDQVIMNSRVIGSKDRHVQVFRNDVEVMSGDSFIPGEVLLVTLSDQSDEFVFEVKNAAFDKGGCNGRRSDKKSNTLRIPMTLNEDISIWAGWAKGHSAVSITDEFVLRPPNLSENEGTVSETSNQNTISDTIDKNTVSEISIDIPKDNIRDEEDDDRDEVEDPSQADSSSLVEMISTGQIDSKHLYKHLGSGNIRNMLRTTSGENRTPILALVLGIIIFLGCVILLLTRCYFQPRTPSGKVE